MIPSQTATCGVELETRKAILELQSAMEALPSVLRYCNVTHHFAPGCYAREMSIPKGTCIVGKIHKHAHLNIISKGKVVVLTESGMRRISAPCTFVSEIGTKRAVLAEEDTVWTTVHVTEETDLEKIEDYVIAKDYNDPALKNLRVGEIL